MASAWLIVLTVISAVLILGATIYVFFLYCHPDDNGYGAGWFAKGLVVLSMSLLWGQVMLLPLDAANARGEGGGLNMDLAYMIIMILYFLAMICFLPFTLFLYETDPDKPLGARICWAFWYTLFLLIAVAGLTLIAWGALREAVIGDLTHTTIGQFVRSELAYIVPTQTELTGRVVYELPGFLFMIVFAVFVGWWLFVGFGGVGIVALPFDMILDFFYRPRPRTAVEMAEKKIALRRRCEELLSYSRALEGIYEAQEEDAKPGLLARWKNSRKSKSKEGKLKRELAILEEEYEIFEVESTLTANPLLAWAKLIAGCLLAVLSFVLLLHLLVYNIIIINGRPADQFLNKVLFWFEFSIARFVSTFVFAGLSIYLVFAVMKGNFKVGLRLFFLIQVHPMKLHRTYMNTFLFNTILIMLSTLGSIHFIILLFADYMRLTTGLTIFGILLTKLTFLRGFWQYKVFLYAFLIVAVATFIYLLLKPKSDRMDIKAMIARRKNL